MFFAVFFNNLAEGTQRPSCVAQRVEKPEREREMDKKSAFVFSMRCAFTPKTKKEKRRERAVFFSLPPLFLSKKSRQKERKQRTTIIPPICLLSPSIYSGYRDDLLRVIIINHVPPKK